MNGRQNGRANDGWMRDGEDPFLARGNSVKPHRNSCEEAFHRFSAVRCSFRVRQPDCESFGFGRRDIGDGSSSPATEIEIAQRVFDLRLKAECCSRFEGPPRRTGQDRLRCVLKLACPCSGIPLAPVVESFVQRKSGCPYRGGRGIGYKYQAWRHLGSLLTLTNARPALW